MCLFTQYSSDTYTRQTLIDIFSARGYNFHQFIWPSQSDIKSRLTSKYIWRKNVHPRLQLNFVVKLIFTLMWVSQRHTKACMQMRSMHLKITPAVCSYSISNRERKCSSCLLITFYAFLTLWYVTTSTYICISVRTDTYAYARNITKYHHYDSNIFVDFF